MNFFFGYIYYRIARHFLSMGENPTGGAVGALSLIQALLLALCVNPLEKVVFKGDNLASHNKVAGFLLLILLCILFIINFRVHFKKYDDYHRRWGNESFKTRTLKGVLVVIFLMSPLLLLWWLQYQPWF